jgi:hypothetical protein
LSNCSCKNVLVWTNKFHLETLQPRHKIKIEYYQDNPIWKPYFKRNKVKFEYYSGTAIWKRNFPGTRSKLTLGFHLETLFPRNKVKIEKYPATPSGNPISQGLKVKIEYYSDNDNS